jgi:hypothetical protein
MTNVEKSHSPDEQHDSGLASLNLPLQLGSLRFRHGSTQRAKFSSSKPNMTGRSKTYHMTGFAMKGV